MSGESILRQYLHGKRDATENAEDEPSDDLGSFGWYRGIRDHPKSIELRKRDGSIVAIPYSWIEEFQFEPDAGITLLYRGQKTRIIGVNLNAEVRPSVRLFEGLARHRVPWVRESVHPVAASAAPTETHVERIDVSV